MFNPVIYLHLLPCLLGTSGSSFNFGFDRKFMGVDSNRSTKIVNAAKGWQIFPLCFRNRIDREEGRKMTISKSH